MNSAIEIMEQLVERWPGMLDMIRVMNGYDVDRSYEELLEINTRINADEEGMKLARQAMEQLMVDFQAGDPEVKAWLEANGFTSQQNIDFGHEMDAIVERIESNDYTSIDELQAMTDRLLDIMETCLRSAARHQSAIGRGFMVMGPPLEDA